MYAELVVAYLLRKTVISKANLLKISDPYVMAMLENVGEK
jgi:hypothetical protein